MKISKIWNCNRLWKFWYTVLTILFQCFVTYNAIRQYVYFKSQHYNPRYGSNWNMGPLHFYISCIIISLSMFGFFVYFCVVKSVEITTGIPALNFHEIIINQTKAYQWNFVAVMKLVSSRIQQSWPYAQALHFLMAMFLLLPLPLMHMEQIRNEVKPSAALWITELDYLTSQLQWGMQQSLMDNQVGVEQLHFVPSTSVVSAPSLESINFLAATVGLAMRLAAPFWPLNRAYSLLCSMLVLLTSGCWLLILQTVALYVRCAGNAPLLQELLTRLQQHQPEAIPEQLLWTPASVTALCTAHVLLILLGFLALFYYGHCQAVLGWIERLSSSSGGGGGGSSTKSDDMRSHRHGSWSYCRWLLPVISVGFLIVVLLVIVDIVLLSALFQLLPLQQQHHRSAVVTMASIGSAVVLLVLLFLVWFSLTLHRRWLFLQPDSFSSCEGGVIQYEPQYDQSAAMSLAAMKRDVSLTSGSCDNGAGGGGLNVKLLGADTVYGCFHNRNSPPVGQAQPGISSVSSTSSSGGTHHHHHQMLETAVMSSNVQNYVYLQPPHHQQQQHIATISEMEVSRHCGDEDDPEEEKPRLSASTSQSSSSFATMPHLFYGGNKASTGKLVSFPDESPLLATYCSTLSPGGGGRQQQHQQLRVPDILAMNSVTNSRSESSLDHCGSSLSSSSRRNGQYNQGPFVGGSSAVATVAIMGPGNMHNSHDTQQHELTLCSEV